MRDIVENSPKVLILGGSNFMGKAVTKWFFDEAPHCEIYMVNRGKRYWNNQIKKDHPKIHKYYGDRKQHKQFAKTINYINQKAQISQQNPWKAVVDFTAYCWRDLQSSIKSLKNKTLLYIFISSDSLYNNTPFDGDFIEEDSFSIQDCYRSLKSKKKKDDKYGYDKLKCEIYLSRTKYVPYICLRLPDVIGPFDNTERYWCSLFWIRKNLQYKLQINQKDEKTPLSFVFSEDIAKFIGKLVINSEIATKNKSYNLCFKESPTFKQFMELIAESINHHQPLNIKYIKNNKDTNGFYPSTEYTSISCEKAIRELEWQPTSLKRAIQITSTFFLDKAPNYEYEKKQMMKEFRRKVVDSD